SAWTSWACGAARATAAAPARCAPSGCGRSAPPWGSAHLRPPRPPPLQQLPQPLRPPAVDDPARRPRLERPGKVAVHLVPAAERVSLHPREQVPGLVADPVHRLEE